MPSLKSAVQEETFNENQKKTVIGFKSNFEKNKMISAYVDIERYKKFTEINKKRGISNNKILNLLISDYVFENEKYLNE